MISASSGMSPGDTPDFVGRMLNGETVQLSDYRGQVVLVNFWATWCPPCRAEMPSIQEAYQRYHEDGFTVLAINNSEPVAQIVPFVDALSLDFPVVLDLDARLQKDFGITGYPTSLFVGPDGSVYATHTGMLSDVQLERYIQQGLSLREA
ncbi:MAG: TlpA family protein disulfide reductase [Anaerolineae bacterium]|nr:TlpA family protein disulfide reductase [Anaerolineae bacterium]